MYNNLSLINGVDVYLTKEMTRSALLKMHNFHAELCSVFDKAGMDFESNLGRRNVVMSQSQEHFFAQELSKVFKDVDADGRTGKADIVIGDIDRELECKLTSGNRSGSVSYSLQTDWETLKNKGSLDYLYVLCDASFEKFCVLYYEGLTTEDFYPPASGSRGKSRMKKSSAMKKVTCLHGSYKIQNHEFIEGYKVKISSLIEESTQKAMNLQKKYFTEKGASGGKAREKIIKMRDDLDTMLNKKVDFFNEKINYWQNLDPRFTFILEDLQQAEEEVD